MATKDDLEWIELEYVIRVSEYSNLNTGCWFSTLGTLDHFSHLQ